MPTLSKLFSLTILWLLFPSISHAFFGSECPEASQGNKPLWVAKGYTYSEPGYRFGFGEAHYKKKQTHQKLLKRAESNAREDLASTVTITIDSKTQITNQLTEKGKSASSTSQVDSALKTSSKLSLPGLPIYKKWQDPQTCNLYVLVRLKEDLIDLVLKKSLVMDFYRKAKNTALPVGERILAAKEAITAAQKAEFSKIQGSESSRQLIRQFEHTLSDLVHQQQKFNHAVVIINKTDEPSQPALSPLLLDLQKLMPGSFELPRECSSSTICLKEANDTSANFASIAEIQMNTVKQSGFWAGDITMEISLWDLKSNRQIHSIDKLATRVMHRQKHRLTLEHAMNKWLRQHQEKFTEYQNAAKQANN